MRHAISVDPSHRVPERFFIQKIKKELRSKKCFKPLVSRVERILQCPLISPKAAKGCQSTFWLSVFSLAYLIQHAHQTEVLVHPSAVRIHPQILKLAFQSACHFELRLSSKHRFFWVHNKNGTFVACIEVFRKDQIERAASLTQHATWQKYATARSAESEFGRLN